MAHHLTDKQAAFLHEYLSNGRNSAAAYRVAYNSTMSKQNCARAGKKLLKQPKIAALVANAVAQVDAHLQRAAHNYAVSRERNVAELARMAYANMADYTKVTANGDRVISLGDNLTRDHLAAISSLEVDTYVDGRGEDAQVVKRTKFKLHDKLAALEALNKMFGWTVEKREVLLLERRLQEATDEERQAIGLDIVRRIRERLAAAGVTPNPQYASSYNDLGGIGEGRIIDVDPEGNDTNY